MTQAHLDLLRRMAIQAQQADMDVGLGANVLIAMLDEIEQLRKNLADAQSVHGYGCVCPSCKHAAWWVS